MKVLFIASSNTHDLKIAPFIKSQGESLTEIGVDISYFLVFGKGLAGYLKNVKKLRAWLKENPTDIIHVHYTLSGWIAVLACPKAPIILSIMGSDAYGNYIGPRKVEFFSRLLTLSTYMIQPFLDAIISKSSNINRFVYRKKIAHIIPNGVRLDHFRFFEKGFRKELNLDENKKYILFLGDPQNKRKNFELLEKACRMLKDPDLKIVAPYPVTHQDVVRYLNSVDVFALTAFMEGSPNVVKEAMACNCPIVATNVGDVEWVLGDTEGCFVSGFDEKEFSVNIEKALAFSGSHRRTKGRDRLIELGLDTESVARKVTGVYQTVLKS